MHIAMFLTLGLFVFPPRLIPVMGVSLLITGVLMFVARPATVLVVTLGSPWSWREKAFVSWVGLRGAVPIILATFPPLAGILEVDLIFNVIFFIALTSVLLQGTSIPPVARWLGVDAPLVPKRAYPIEYVPMDGLKSELKELPIPPGSRMQEGPSLNYACRPISWSSSSPKITSFWCQTGEQSCKAATLRWCFRMKRPTMRFWPGQHPGIKRRPSAWKHRRALLMRA